MPNYLEHDTPDIIERLDKLILKSNGKSEKTRANRVLVAKGFLMRVREILAGDKSAKDIKLEQEQAEQQQRLAIVKDGYDAHRVRSESLAENPYPLSLEATSEYRLWNKGWWASKNNKPEPTEV